MKKTFKRIILTLLLALLLLVSVLPISTMFTLPKTSIVNTVKYNSWSFYDRSSPQYIELQMETTILSLVGYCENTTQTDDLIFHIISTSDYSKNIDLTIPFKADGEPETFTLTLPSGEYKISFSGNETIKKTNAIVVFSVEV